MGGHFTVRSAFSTMARCPWIIGRVLVAQAFTSRSSPLFASFWNSATSFLWSVSSSFKYCRSKSADPMFWALTPRVSNLTPFRLARSVSSLFALVWSATMRAPILFTSALFPCFSAIFPFSTSCWPPPAAFWIKFTSFWLSFTVTVPEAGVGADFARRWGLLPMPVSSLPSWARMVPITDRLPAMVAMIANREIDMNSGFIGLFLFTHYISSSVLWHVKLEIWTLARLFGSLFPTGTFVGYSFGLKAHRMARVNNLRPANDF